MARTMLSQLAVAALLSTAAGGAALSQDDGRDFLVWKRNFGPPAGIAARNKAKKAQRPGSFSGQPRRQRFYYNKIPLKYAPTKDGK